MTFTDLLKDSIFELPLKQPKSGSFKTFLTEKLNLFLEKVNSLDDGIIHETKPHITVEYVKKTQKKIILSLISCVEEYYNGNPFKAYKKLHTALQNDYKNLYNVLNHKEYVENESFFRIRLNEKNYPYQKKEMFHIPFELRNKVSTQRFSIPGFPSLYLGRTIYICWEELNRPSIDKIQAVKLKNTKPLKLLDLTPPDKDCKNIDELYRFFMTFPLIMSCSVKVRDTSDTFKPEYIVPQLLLQWIRSNQNLDGIQYKSTHLTSKVFNEKSELINVVLPVKSNEDKGICKELASCFESTETFSWNLYQFTRGGQIFIYGEQDAIIVNKKIPKLELIEGESYPYFYSTLGRLEYHLELGDTKKIE